MVPLRARGRALGALTLCSGTPGRYDQRDLELASDLADRAGMAIDNAQLYREAQRAVRSTANRPSGRGASAAPDGEMPEVRVVTAGQHRHASCDVRTRDASPPRVAEQDLPRDCGFRPSRSAIPADADHPFRQGGHPERDAAR